MAKIFDFTTAQAVRAPSGRESDMHGDNPDSLAGAGSWFRMRDSSTVEAWSDEIAQQRADLLNGAKPGYLRLLSFAWPHSVAVICPAFGRS